jgi:hypothetical protein
MAERKREVITNFKQERYRNKEILRLAKGQECKNCCINNGTTVAAHANGLFHGHGVGLKSHDFFVAYLCSTCHTLYDTHKMNQQDFDRAMKLTMLVWVPKLLEVK